MEKLNTKNAQFWGLKTLNPHHFIEIKKNLPNVSHFFMTVLSFKDKLLCFVNKVYVTNAIKLICHFVYK